MGRNVWGPENIRKRFDFTGEVRESLEENMSETKSKGTTGSNRPSRGCVCARGWGDLHVLMKDGKEGQSNAGPQTVAMLDTGQPLAREWLKRVSGRVTQSSAQSCSVEQLGRTVHQHQGPRPEAAVSESTGRAVDHSQDPEMDHMGFRQVHSCPIFLQRPALCHGLHRLQHHHGLILFHYCP